MWKLRIKTRSHQNQYHFKKCHIAHKTVDLKFHVSNLTSLEYVFGIAIEIVPAQGFHKHVTSFLTRCIWMYMNITSAVTLAEMRILLVFIFSVVGINRRSSARESDALP